MQMHVLAGYLALRKAMKRPWLKSGPLSLSPQASSVLRIPKQHYSREFVDF